MIIWLNGTFGAGKSTASGLVAGLIPGARVFDSELVGEMLVPPLHSVKVRDFQEWPPWRALVVETAVQVLDYVGGTLVIPQTVLVEEYWREIRSGLRRTGVPVRHFVLHAERDVLTRRIHGDPDKPASQWRLEHLDDYEEALPWLRREAEVIETDDLAPEPLARLIVERASEVPPAGREEPGESRPVR